LLPVARLHNWGTAADVLVRQQALVQCLEETARTQGKDAVSAAVGHHSVVTHCRTTNIKYVPQF
jgi:hypothetical protein